MINQWQSMMDNLSDIYYLVRLIVRQVSIYLRDLIIYKFFWITTNNDEFDSSDPKLRALTFRNFTTDIVAFSIICVVLFLLVIIASKCEKDEGPLYAASSRETVAVDLTDDPFCISNTSSTTTNCFHACGDSICPRERVPKRNFSAEDMSRFRGPNRRRHERMPKKSIFGLNVIQTRNSQSTQTTDQIFHRTAREWLIRRTRSGHIYGKYRI